MLVPATAQAMATALRGEFHAGSGSNVTLELYTADYALLLVTFNLGTAPFAAATLPSAGNPSVVALTGAPFSATGVADGTPAAYRLKDRDGTIRGNATGAGAVSTTPGAAFVIVTAPTVTNTQNINLLSIEYRIPTDVTPLPA